MVTAAFRYCMGRSTYIVSDCVDWLMDVWPHLNQSTKALIKRELVEGFRADDEARSRGATFFPLGHDCDRDQWRKLKAFVDAQSLNDPAVFPWL